MPVPFLPKKPIYFPHSSQTDSQGLLAWGGDLSATRLILAYQNGIFPWYNQGEPILWWCLTPRLLLFPQHIHISKSMHPVINNILLDVTMDKDFEAVIRTCKNSARKETSTSWIHEEMIIAFLELHQKGIAHSVEVWHSGKLVGGMYGLAIGKMFCGESMFALMPNTSKLALIRLAAFLVNKSFTFIDCQQESEHMKKMGARLYNQSDFFKLLDENLQYPVNSENWALDFDKF